MQAADGEVNKLLKQGVINKAVHSEGQFVSNIFLRPKPNGSHRVILDLTLLNKLVTYTHFKMFSLKNALDLVTHKAWMGSIDLKNAYYSVSVRKPFRKYLRFIWRNQLYEYTCMPNGLSVCPRVFTKLLKPIYAKLSNQGFVMFPYIDDSFIIAEREDDCTLSIQALSAELVKAGFTLNLEKSVLKPRQEITFLGFNINTIKMQVTLTNDKVVKFKDFASKIIDKRKKLKIRQVAAIIGLMVAYSQGLQYACSHIKSLEIDKNAALARAKGNYNRNMKISWRGLEDLNWWLLNIEGMPKNIKISDPEILISTDASLEGWGAQGAETSTGGRWLPEEADEHINVLELKAIYLGLCSLANTNKSTVKVFTDNCTALAYVRKMGGTRSPRCNEITKKIWDWAEARSLWLKVEYIPSRDNIVADAKSRKFHDHLEWSLSQDIFDELCSLWGTPDVDLFASRNNFKLFKYVSWQPEPNSWKVDAFTFKWKHFFFYAFPPFSMVGRVARKMHHDGTKAILLAPLWATQPWLAAARNWSRQSVTFQRAPNNLCHNGPLAPKGDVHSTPLVAFLF